MPSIRNKNLYDELNKIINERPNLIFTTYSGLSVAEMEELRKKLKEKNTEVKVVKNNILKLVLKNSPGHDFESKKQEVENTIQGPIAVVFGKEEISSAAKFLFEEGKKQEKIQIIGGYYEGKFINKSEMQSIANLPSREELLAIIARGFNTPAQKIAYIIKEIIAKNARAIKSIAEKKNN